jgi:hypothetical protein
VYFDGAGAVETTRRVRATTSPSELKVKQQTNVHRSRTSNLERSDMTKAEISQSKGEL